MSVLRWLLRLVYRSRFDGLLISPSPLIRDGCVALKQNGREVGYGLLSEVVRHPKGCDEVVVSPSDWHEIMVGRLT